MFDSMRDYLAKTLSAKNIVICELEDRITNIRRSHTTNPVLLEIKAALEDCVARIEEIPDE